MQRGGRRVTAMAGQGPPWCVCVWGGGGRMSMCHAGVASQPTGANGHACWVSAHEVSAALLIQR